MHSLVDRRMVPSSSTDHRLDQSYSTSATFVPPLSYSNTIYILLFVNFRGSTEIRKQQKQWYTWHVNCLTFTRTVKLYIALKVTRLEACQSKSFHQACLRPHSFSTSVCLPRPDWQLRRGVIFIHLWTIFEEWMNTLRLEILHYHAGEWTNILICPVVVNWTSGLLQSLLAG